MKLAHENYVLPQASIDRGMADWSVNVFDALKDPANVKIAVIVGLGFLAVVVLYYFFMTSRTGLALSRKMEKLEPFGDIVLRVALAASLVASAYFNSFLGPEIPLSSIPFGEFFRQGLFVTGLLILIGLYTEIAAIFGLAILILVTFVYRDYIVTYLNYYGELLALIFFGSRIFSVDQMRLSASSFFQKFKKWEIPLIRVTYGISVLYPAITIKILHPSIMVEIAEKYRLADLWLFPSDPLLISLGTGLTQIAVGLAIILGFQTRLNSAITLGLYIMSIIFFKEAVWPHYILLALGVYLIINKGGGYSLDKLIEKRALIKNRWAM